MKFSIVTPAYNIAEFLPATIESVLSQEGDFEIEYIIATDPSPDNTVAIVEDYTKKVSRGEYLIRCTKLTLTHLPLTGSGSMNAAMNEAFSRATGDVYGWIAGDDVYQHGAFEKLRRIFESETDIAWIKGKGGCINKEGLVTSPGTTYLYHQPWLVAGVYGMEAYHLNQDSSLWRSWLWKKHGPFPKDIKVMGDYWLWLQFSKTTPLWSANIDVSHFRKHDLQGSKVLAEACLKSMWWSRGNKRPLAGWIARLFFFPYFHIASPFIKRIMEWLYPLVFPHHSRWYLSLEHDGVKRRKASTFIVPQ